MCVRCWGIAPGKVHIPPLGPLGKSGDPVLASPGDLDCDGNHGSRARTVKNTKCDPIACNQAGPTPSRFSSSSPL
jgi:hypothetical protein